jgi:pyruvate kinase
MAWNLDPGVPVMLPDAPPPQILSLCEAAHVPAIWATRVVETLAKTGQPSRGNRCRRPARERVILNKGPHIVDAIRALDDFLARMGEVHRQRRTLMRHIRSWDAH